MSAQAVNQMLDREVRNSSDTLSIWLFIAAVFHAIVLMGVTFESPKPQIISKAIEVTIVNSATKKAPENAKYFAQANQIAAGLEEQKPRPVTKKKPHAGHDSKRQHETKASKAQTIIEHRLITQKTAEKKLNSAQKQEDNQAQNENKQQSELSIEELDKQIALLEAKLQSQKENSEKTRIKSINGISAHKQVAAKYIKDWERKVERAGNLNIPEINGRKDFSGTLTMDVAVNADGSIYNIKIVKSSGIAELDEAATQIVKMMAPFTPLPEEITQETDVLRIRREWIFSDDGNVFTSTSQI